MNFGLRISNNLFTSGRFFGFHLEKDSPQIAGLGIHYTFGVEEEQEKVDIDLLLKIVGRIMQT